MTMTSLLQNIYVRKSRSASPSLNKRELTVVSPSVHAVHSLFKRLRSFFLMEQLCRSWTSCNSYRGSRYGQSGLTEDNSLSFNLVILDTKHYAVKAVI